jgi:glucose-1-phosphate thymidylyltransferase
MKIIIPMAGLGKRLGPLTRHKPKALVRLANTRLLDHVLGIFQGLEQKYTLEYVFIVGHMGEQIKEHMKAVYPHKQVIYFKQEQLLGQSHAVYLAKEAISGPVLLTYCDTINKMNFSFLSAGSLDGMAAVREVDDPRRHGVAIVGPDNVVTKLVEKPKTMEHKLALTGLYYFSDGKELVKAIEAQIQRGKSLNNEYYLADAINILVEAGMRIRVEKVLQWLDAGTPEAMIDTNAALLRQQTQLSKQFLEGQSNLFIPPIYVHESAHVQSSIIGPNVSIGENCSITGSILKNSVVDDGTRLVDVNLENSLTGRSCIVTGNPVQTIVADYGEERISSIIEENRREEAAGS